VALYGFLKLRRYNSNFAYMTKKNFILGTTLLALFVLMSFSVLNSGGKAGYTGSPGEGTCANCHSGGTGNTNILFSSIPAMVNNEYQPSTTYRMLITIENQNYSSFGFGCEILDSLNANAGTMSNAGTGVKFLNSGSRKNAVHSTAKSGTGSAVFEFDWIAPADGKATIYVSGNAVNLNGGTSGDQPGNASFTLNPVSITSISNNNVHFTDVKVFPNPCKNEFTLQIAEIPKSLNLYDMAGKSYALPFEKFSTFFYKVFLGYDLTPGTYLLKVTTISQKVYYQKIQVLE